MTLKDKKGFSLIEVMIGAAILLIAISVSLFMVQNRVESSTGSTLGIALEVVRSNMQVYLQDDRAWYNTVNNAANLNLSCLKKGTDCFKQGGPVRLIADASGAVVYDSASEGFSPAGDICTTYNPIKPDPTCPIHFDLTWAPICTSSPCLNPPVQLTGTFTISTLDAPPLNMSLYNIVAYNRMKVTCDIQQSFVLQNPQGNVKILGGDQVVATVSGSALTGTVGAVPIEACNDSILSFSYQLSYSGSAKASDPQNTADVCFQEAGGPANSPCVYEWKEAQGAWLLNYNVNGASGSVPAPTGDSTNGAVQYEFKWNNGLMTFYYNGARTYVFTAPYYLPLTVSFQPGSTSYSPNGFQNILFSEQ